MSENLSRGRSLLRGSLATAAPRHAPWPCASVPAQRRPRFPLVTERSNGATLPLTKRGTAKPER
jgi:hypothetical protein